MSQAQEPTPEVLGGLFEELQSCPQVLVVLNHPLWNLRPIPDSLHLQLLDQFLECWGGYVHALELNGLRNWS